MKKQIENNEIKTDSGLIEIFEDKINYCRDDLNRIKQFVREKEIKLEMAQDKLDHYKKTGVVMTDIELRKKHGLI